MDRRTCLRLSLMLNVLLLLAPLYSLFHNTAGEPYDEELLAKASPKLVESSNLLAHNGYDGAQLPSSTPPEVKIIPSCSICESGDIGERLCNQWGEAAMSRGIAYAGSNNRLRRVLAKMRAGEPFSMGVVGGSVSAGHGLHGTKDDESLIMHNVLFDHLDELFPSRQQAAKGPGHMKDGVRNVYYNGAEPARGSDYFSMCQQLHLAPDVDLVVVELAINDPPHLYTTLMFENLIRSMLELPSKPAVLLLNVFALSFENIAMGGVLNLGNAQYYDVPILSTQNVALPSALGNHSILADWFATNLGKTADYDTLEHVDLRHFGKEMHVFSGELMASYIDAQLCEMDRIEARRPNTKPEDLYPVDPLPRLRLQDKFTFDKSTPQLKPFCIATNSDAFPLTPKSQTGWRDWAWKDKKYLVADTVGAKLTFEFTTSIGQVVLYFLRSWEFPLGNLMCWVDDDVAGAKVAVGHWDFKMNIGRTESWGNLSPGRHELHCEVLQETDDPSGGHEVRLISLMSI